MLSVRAARVIAGAVPMAFLLLLLVPQPASACTVSYGYKPQMNFNAKDLRLGSGRVCTNGTSLTGSAIVALLAVGALAAAGTRAFKRGAASTGSSSPGQALTTYLEAAGTVSPASEPGASQPGDDGAHP
ncbi:hypothetical protein [Streptomyces sp. G-G2]|uniref:hypothetical protein n=1 Tax=Streptomyces sp. G-G2 TaxID=3046201 RepID=UPI0024BAA1B0|nr:hypothetical protein [Streptomyces sp. G-G2]MDJ0383745.1 hypothetical protein [Streptomyces sp. G-G2]